MKTKKYALILFLICNSLLILAQNSEINIYIKNGTTLSFPHNTIDSVTYSNILTYDSLPVISTIIDILSDTSHEVGGIVIHDGGSNVSQRGIVWSTTQNPVIENQKTLEGVGVGSFTSNLKGLSGGVTYYVRAYAINSRGIAYGNQVSFTTKVQLATLNTLTITSITSTTAVTGVDISNDGGETITSKGVCWSTNPNPTIIDNKTIDGSGLDSFTSNLKDLTFNTTYYVRAYAINSRGIAYGNQVSFTTKVQLASLNTLTITSITSTTAVTGGNITNDGGGTITQKGVCWSTNPNPTIIDNKTIDGSGLDSFTSNLKDLTFNTIYYVRAYAINSEGIAYGNQVSFTTKYTPGEIGPAGGLIFYDKGNYDDGWRYLEAAPIDQSISAPWGCNRKSIPNTQKSVGSGKQNTALILAGCNESNIAAKICNDLILGGKDDWFLPSIGELELMYHNLYINNLGNFRTRVYWSSSEFTNTNAWYFVFYYGNANFDNGKYKTSYVRAVRAF